MPESFTFTAAKTIEELRDEVVADLTARAAKENAAARAASSAADKRTHLAASEALAAAAKMWSETHIGDPRKAQAVQAPSPTVSGGRTTAS